MRNLIFLTVCLFFLLNQIVKSKISEAVAQGFFQECLQASNEVFKNNKAITAKKIENYCICSVNELDKLVDDNGYEKLMLKHYNPDHKSKEFDIILNECKIHLN